MAVGVTQGVTLAVRGTRSRAQPTRQRCLAAHAATSNKAHLPIRVATFEVWSGVGVSVLLRRLHGFEGLGVVPEELQQEDLAVSHGVDGCHLHVQVWAVTFAV